MIMKQREIKTNSTNLKKGFYKREELELYGFDKNEIEVVQIYQKNFPQLLQDVNGFVIDARPLWMQLGEPQGDYSNWINRKIIKKGFVKNIDFELNHKTVEQVSFSQNCEKPHTSDLCW